MGLKHNNIMVKYHPKLMLHYWSHHEKQVIIDQCVMFMGGLDLCFGRYETVNYPLKDPTYYYQIEKLNEDMIIKHLKI